MKMNAPFRLFVLLIVSVSGSYTIPGKTSLDPFPLGTIGCLVSDVCESGEICTNDLLFGSCESIFSRAVRRQRTYELETNEIKRLEDEIQKLIKAGFTWKDALTQCTLQNMLLEFGHGREFNRHLCEDALGVGPLSVTGDINQDIVRVLMILDSDEPNLQGISEQPSYPDADIDLLNSDKRDEIVQVHKYFDQSAGQLKRDPFFKYQALPGPNIEQETPENYLDTLPWKDTAKDTISLDDDIKSIIPLIDNGEDTISLNKYRDEPILLSDGDDKNEDAQNLGLPDLPVVNDLVPYQEMDRTDDLQYSKDQSDSRGNSDNRLYIDNLSLNPEDKEVFEKLLRDEISPRDLEPNQQRRLQTFIKGLIQIIDGNSGNDPLFSSDDNASQLGGMTSVGEPGLSEMRLDVDKAVASHDSAGDMSALIQNVGNGNSEGNPAVDSSRIPQLSQKALIDKETKTKNPHKSHYVDPHSVYLELSKEISTENVELFVQNLTKILNLPKGLLELNKVGPGRMISLKVRSDPSGKWDAEKITKDAQSSNREIERATGIRIEAAGVGTEGNRVEVKEDDRDVVLTFILVGTIAGVVLSVVTIYLIKRHNRSKQKLAQIADNNKGIEPSKDYQDLCRQRMQGKLSEKPEPLQAASRIGSVSESQVRSPSSKSSTSSWSEEPAASNMDIFTGHIVLSYMEDHLKNQDRLDQEWEAVSSYVPDPASTKIASSHSNMRKNRFPDIQPYDHSRVILSTNTNVNNSDYINANFITDHDPRNPAYICTQGPLPHTVADFWQMIWEQGCAVIVMLTKLVENGESLCHRYWPEEGSDLYHIYEVHLVSVHIWCDDYLVRSFYLKNLQTSETRTVTQFHFLTWPDMSIPASIKALLDFRRKVNKSFRGRSCPIAVHCSDGCGRSGTYCLIDMVLNKMAKGAKEIDMAATLEHIRDQRMSMVRTKEQFQFSLASVAEEVHAILKALPQ